jgi:hypothetical protein
VGAPAENTPLLAEDAWRHLQAAVAGDAVELLLVAVALALKRLLQPEAQFRGGMPADEPVMLLLERFFILACVRHAHIL